MVKTNMRALMMATGVAALMLGGAGVVWAEEMDHSKMDHSKMDHGSAPEQWADPGKAQAAAPTDAAKPGEPPKADAAKPEDHSGHHGGGGMGDMSGMDHGKGGGMMGGMGGMMGGGMMGGMDHGGGKGGGMGGMMKGMMCGFADHLDGRIAYLKAELKLTDAQTGAWNTFADAWRAAAQTAQQKCAAMDAHKMDHAQPAVLAKLSMMESHMTDHLEIVRAQKAAIEGLFTTLSDEQKKIASDTFSSVMKVGGGMMGGGGMGGMGGMSHGGGMDHGKGGTMGGMQH